MKIVKLIDGLANQMFEYVFGRYVEITTGESVFFDDSYCSVRDVDTLALSGKDSTNGEMDGYSFTSNEITRVFGLNLNVLRNYFSDDVWDYIVKDTQRHGLYKALKHCAPNLHLVAESWVLSENASDPDYNNARVFSAPTFRFAPEILRIRGDVYYAGVWINRLWFYSIADVIKKEFEFPPLQDGNNISYQERIEKTNSVGIHIRRGGFVINGYTMDMKWYKSAIKHIRGIISKPEFFIFSDDVDWCESNISVLGLLNTDDITIIRGNYGLGNYNDMHLMSLCKHLIIANSTFSLWAALLNKNPNKIVLSPDQHYFI